MGEAYTIEEADANELFRYGLKLPYPFDEVHAVMSELFSFKVADERSRSVFDVDDSGVLGRCGTLAIAKQGDGASRLSAKPKYPIEAEVVSLAERLRIYAGIADTPHKQRQLIRYGLKFESLEEVLSRRHSVPLVERMLRLWANCGIADLSPDMQIHLGDGHTIRVFTPTDDESSPIIRHVGDEYSKARGEMYEARRQFIVSVVSSVIRDLRQIAGESLATPTTNAKIAHETQGRIAARRREVMRLRDEGSTIRDIAKHLRTSRRTIDADIAASKRDRKTKHTP